MLRLHSFLLLLLALCCAIARPEGAALASPFALEEIVGWYRVDEDSRQLMTWSGDGGLNLTDFETLKKIEFRPVSEEVYSARNGRGEEYQVRFDRDGSGDVAGFAWVDASGVRHTARRLDVAKYTQQEISFQNRSLELVGLLFAPSDPGAYPAVVVVSGGGDAARDDPWVLYQADYLARRGIAVFMPDTRGTGKSGGAWETATFEDLSEDAAAAARALKQNERIDPLRIGAIGIGEGGWTVPITAASSSDIRFLVTVSGSALTPKEHLRHEISSDLRRYGTPDFLVPLISFALEFRSSHRDEDWWEQNGRFDVVPYWERLNKPVLALYGRRAERSGIPVRRCIERLESARQASGNTQFTIRVLDEAGPRMDDPETGRVHEEYLDLLSGWISSQAA